MMIEFLYHVFALDIAWISNFTLINFFWIVAFAAAMYYLNDDKKTVQRVFLLIILLWAFSDLLVLTGWNFAFLLLPIMTWQIFFPKLSEEYPLIAKGGIYLLLGAILTALMIFRILGFY